ncbi:Transposon Tf2-9 polyprotein [Smittium culicis]|uniref:Transposon Tf2-9 polyprotein n=1 Tax=Smittium culicis TaxID=133412 RepID=A0A1R1XKE2_9FUNG|nr:Transposon Tf2-9 polyprotein [Smittium culicis]
MVTVPVLAHPQTEKGYTMYTDVSNIGLGAAIYQEQEDGELKPIAYARRKLIPAVVNYSATDKEALAVVYGFDKFHHYIHGTKKILYNDHRALVSSLNSQDPRVRIARWNSTLQ